MELAEAVLAENDLGDQVQAFLEDEEQPPIYYIDRHVLGVDEDVTPDLIRKEACFAAMVLARRWDSMRSTLSRSDVLISKPFVVIDDAWVWGRANSPPPHVQLCIARNEASFRPVEYDDNACPQTASGIAMIDVLVVDGVTLKRVEPDPDFPEDAEDGGCWILELP